MTQSALFANVPPVVRVVLAQTALRTMVVFVAVSSYLVNKTNGLSSGVRCICNQHDVFVCACAVTDVLWTGHRS